MYMRLIGHIPLLCFMMIFCVARLKKPIAKRRVNVFYVFVSHPYGFCAAFVESDSHFRKFRFLDKTLQR